MPIEEKMERTANPSVQSTQKEARTGGGALTRFNREIIPDETRNCCAFSRRGDRIHSYTLPGLLQKGDLLQTFLLQRTDGVRVSDDDVRDG